jgi:hypothetical protein
VGDVITIFEDRHAHTEEAIDVGVYGHSKGVESCADLYT